MTPIRVNPEGYSEDHPGELIACLYDGGDTCQRAVVRGDDDELREYVFTECVRHLTHYEEDGSGESLRVCQGDAVWIAQGAEIALERYDAEGYLVNADHCPVEVLSAPREPIDPFAGAIFGESVYCAVCDGYYPRENAETCRHLVCLPDIGWGGTGSDEPKDHRSSVCAYLADAGLAYCWTLATALREGVVAGIDSSGVKVRPARWQSQLFQARTQKIPPDNIILQPDQDTEDIALGWLNGLDDQTDPDTCRTQSAARLTEAWAWRVWERLDAIDRWADRERWRADDLRGQDRFARRYSHRMAAIARLMRIRIRRIPREIEALCEGGEWGRIRRALPPTRDQELLRQLSGGYAINPLWLWSRSLEAVWFELSERQREHLRQAEPKHKDLPSEHVTFGEQFGESRQCDCHVAAAEVRALAARMTRS